MEPCNLAGKEVLAMLTKKCRKCSGDLFVERDVLQTFLVCLQCGNRMALRPGLSRPIRFVITAEDAGALRRSLRA